MKVSDLCHNSQILDERYAECLVPEELVPAMKALVEELKIERQKISDTNQKLSFLKAAVDALPNPIFLKDDELRFAFFNQAYRNFFGLKNGENIGKRVQDLSYLSQEDRERYHREDSEQLRALSVIQYHTTFDKADHRQVDSLYWSKGFQTEDTLQRGVVGEIVDVSKETELAHKLKQNMSILKVMLRDAKDAYHTDPLTHLYNRNILTSEIPALISQTMDAGQPLCILMIDLDAFKSVNDTYGHAVGDSLLCHMADALTGTFRQKDIIIRYGGDEFIVIMTGIEASQTPSLTDRLRDKIREKCILPDGNHVTSSIGITQWRENDNFESAFLRADEALYEAKKLGKDRAVIHG